MKTITAGSGFEKLLRIVIENLFRLFAGDVVLDEVLVFVSFVPRKAVDPLRLSLITMMPL
ncbi:MAG: hypothetical protein M1335_02475 [Chloroflexi bacterium]|nr:hypothetical protein [Chloroflexota bacterium]